MRIARRWPSTCREPAGADPLEPRSQRARDDGVHRAGRVAHAGHLVRARPVARHHHRHRRHQLRRLLLPRRGEAGGERRACQTRHEGRAAGARARGREHVDRRRPHAHAARLHHRRPRAQRLRRGPQALRRVRRRHDGPRRADGSARARGRDGPRDLAHPQSRRAADDARGRARRRDRADGRPADARQPVRRRPPRPQQREQRPHADHRDRGGDHRADLGGAPADGALAPPRVPRRRLGARRSRAIPKGSRSRSPSWATTGRRSST